MDFRLVVGTEHDHEPAPATAGIAARYLFALTLSFLLLLTPFAAGAQESGEGAGFRRFAVGGGFQLGTTISGADNDPFTPGASGGFEFRVTEKLSLVSEVAWTSGYEVWPGMTHDYFLYVEGKLRWVVTDMRHPPYFVFGLAHIRDHDTSVNTYRMVGGEWINDPSNPVVREEITGRNFFVTGLGWTFHVGDRLEIRPETDFYIGACRCAFWRTGVSLWYTF